MNIVVRGSVYSPSRIDSLRQHTFIRHFLALNERGIVFVNSICYQKFPVFPDAPKSHLLNCSNIHYDERRIGTRRDDGNIAG